MQVLFGRGRRWRRVSGIERRLLPRSIRLTIDDEVVGGVLESIDGALGEQHIIEHRQPLGSVAIAGDDHGRSTGALEEQLVDVFALLFAHGIEREVIDDEQVDRGERDDLDIARIVESALLERAQHLVSASKAYVIAVTASDVAEG